MKFHLQTSGAIRVRCFPLDQTVQGCDNVACLSLSLSLVSLSLSACSLIAAADEGPHSSYYCIPVPVQALAQALSSGSNAKAFAAALAQASAVVSTSEITAVVPCGGLERH